MTTTTSAARVDSGAALPPWAVALTAQLVAEHGGTLSPTYVEELVREEIGNLQPAPVRDFVPVLVERRLRQRLRSLSPIR